MPSVRDRSRGAEDAYCPHCHLIIESDAGEDWPPQPLRCPHCRLLVGARRALSTPPEEPGARGSAAGVFAHRAKRSGAGGDVSERDICAAIRRVAEHTGARPGRLLMVDYQQEAAEDRSLPPLTEVFAAFGSWKRARRAAAASG